MATSPFHPSSSDVALAQSQPMFERITWRGGPRPPLAGTHRHGLTWDDLDGVLHPGDSGAHAANRASRRWALDSETEQRWQRLLQLHRPKIPEPDVILGPSSAVDSRVSFFGPREPRRAPRSRNSPLTPHTPYTPFTPFTPSSPELETPDDLVPGPNKQDQKSPHADSEQISALEHTITGLPWRAYMITPFRLWEHRDGSRTEESALHDKTNDTSVGHPLSLQSQSPSPLPGAETLPQRRWWVVNATPQDVETSSGSPAPSAGSAQVEPPQSPLNSRSPRPRLSINTSVQTHLSARASGALPRHTQSQSAVAESTFTMPSNVPPSNNDRLSMEPSPLSYASSAPNHEFRDGSQVSGLPQDSGTQQFVPRYYTPTDSSDIIPRLITKLTADVLQDKFKYRALLAHRGDEAQLTLDCLQLLLDSPLLGGQGRTMILKALTRLSIKSGLYPHCFKLSDIKPLGSEAVDEGRYGDVWKAISHDKVVCLKVLRTYQRMPTQPLLKMLSNEALLWGQLSHPNILPFYGIHFSEVRRSRFGLVSPWMENGNVVSYLKLNPDVPRTPLIHDIASGLKYLHSLDIVHGDIKGTNILVASDGRACLADFGLSTILGDNILVWSSDKSLPGCSGGTTRWRAPELFIKEAYDLDSVATPATDVYSFSCAAYEILTGEIPFYEIRGDAAVTLKLFRSCAKPSRPSPVDTANKGIGELTDEMWRLLEDCWNHDPSERPSVEEVLQRLEAMPCEELRQARGDNLDANVGLSSSTFRTSITQLNKPSNDDLLSVLSLISMPPPSQEV